MRDVPITFTIEREEEKDYVRPWLPNVKYDTHSFTFIFLYSIYFILSINLSYLYKERRKVICKYMGKTTTCTY